MRTVVVTYEVNADRADENQALVEAVYAELAERRPVDLRYATFRLADGVSFVHVASVDGDGDPLSGITAFAAFQAGIRERCTTQPAATVASVVGAYRMLGD
jgi:hypothetical protein